MRVLAGDLGGTKALLGIAELGGERPEFLLTRRLASADFSDVAALLARFRAEAGDAMDGITSACLAVAGPVAADGRRARFTNLPWQADVAALSVQLGVPLRLVNDFAAVAAGVTAASLAHLVTLQAGEPEPEGVRLAIGAGTGLGVAAMLGAGAELRILPSEGGHVGFAPMDEAQARIWRVLVAEHGRVTAERVISGPGLAAIHRILSGADETPEAIGARALEGEFAARVSVDMFFACYGAFAGDMALTFMARGGVFLAGGVTQKLLPLLPGSGFLAAFNAKVEHAELARTFPVRAVADPEAGLVGAALLARQQGI
ncbi:MAG: glucokinase [Pseudomonadota bacterium]